MANDFSGDANCVSVFNLEDGALTTDSKGTNTLSNVNTVTADTTNKKQGGASGLFTYANAEYLYRTDANLSAGFPLKSSGGATTFSVTFWMRPASISALRGILCKGHGSTSGFRFFIYSDGTLYMYADSALHGFGTVLSGANRWFHIGFTYQESDKSYRVRVWDDTAGALLGTDLTGNLAHSMGLTDVMLYLGYSTDDYYGGNLDEVVWFTDILTADEIDQIRQGTYGAAATTLPPTTLAPTTISTTLSPTTVAPSVKGPLIEGKLTTGYQLIGGRLVC